MFYRILVLLPNLLMYELLKTVGTHFPRWRESIVPKILSRAARLVHDSRSHEEGIPALPVAWEVEREAQELSEEWLR